MYISTRNLCSAHQFTFTDALKKNKEKKIENKKGK